MTRVLEILYNEGSDTIVLGDPETGDDIAEVFHNERHTVNQTVEQALETARLFRAAPVMFEVLCLALPVICEAQEALCGDEACTDADGNDALHVLRDRIAAAIAKVTAS